MCVVQFYSRYAKMIIETGKQLWKYSEAIYSPIVHFDIYIGDNLKKLYLIDLNF
jgi:hypothetical protein